MITTTLPSIDKFDTVVKKLEADHGPFYLFALFLREDSVHRWDLVVSASWLREGSLADLRILAEPLQAQLSPVEMIQLSHISIVDWRDVVVNNLLPLYTAGGTQQPVEFFNRVFFGKDIRHGIILRAHQPEAKNS